MKRPLKVVRYLRLDGRESLVTMDEAQERRMRDEGRFVAEVPEAQGKTRGALDRDLWSWAGIWVVGITAAIWSFTSLSALAELVGITTTLDLWGITVHISWGLPLTVDVLAAVATRVWLRGEAPDAAVSYARRAAWVAIGASVAGNAYHGWLSGGRIDTVIISAVPAVVIGALVHLAVLVGRTHELRPGQASPSLAPGGPDPHPTPSRPLLSDGDEEIIDAAQRWARELGRPPSRDEMLRRYQIGAKRCRRLREYLGWADPVGTPDPHPTPQEADQ